MVIHDNECKMQRPKIQLVALFYVQTQTQIM